MKGFTIILFICFLPICFTLRCYVCTSAFAGCGEPFNATGSGVSIINMTTFSYCMKTNVVGVITRAGSSACVSYSINSNTYATCCQTDLCNGIGSQCQASIFLVLSIIILLFKFTYN